ncbi:hypothetical protein KAI87_02620, partial [Myxococcota bacterium]|nr:hypothetical protein [Myxococcota bacterium]
MENNLFTELASPDEGADHHAHLAYLVSLLEAFEQTGDARIKPMRRKLHTAIIELTEGTEQGLSTEELALKFQKRIADLQVQTYEVLNIVVNQLRATLRMKLKRSPPMVGGVNMQELQDNLG